MKTKVKSRLLYAIAAEIMVRLQTAMEEMEALTELLEEEETVA